MCSDRNRGDFAAGAFARGCFGDLRIRLLPRMQHHRAMLATTVASYRQLRTAICDRQKRGPKQHDCEQRSDEFSQVLHDFTSILLLRRYTGL
jgi:hypothetical protein